MSHLEKLPGSDPARERAIYSAMPVKAPTSASALGQPLKVKLTGKIKFRRIFVVDFRIWGSAEFRALWRYASTHNDTLMPRSYKDHRKKYGSLTKAEVRQLQTKNQYKSVRRHLFLQAIYRYGYWCNECGGDSPGTIYPDHVVPLRQHGTNDFFNIQLLCYRCNESKSGVLPVPPL